MERLQKVLARAGIASRRAAEKIISQGRVAVDGTVVSEQGMRVDPARQRIEVDGVPISVDEEKVYCLLNKPSGYVTTLSDPQGRPVVTDLLPDIAVRVFPVGRLDIDTEGALLLTNDGDLGQRIQHPSNNVVKTYEAVVAGHPGSKKLAQLKKGILLDGKRTWPAEIEILSEKQQNTNIRVRIHEGRKRQVRKMFAAIGHPVLELRRTAYGGLKLGKLAAGKYRLLTQKDLDLIFSKNNSAK